MSEKLLKLTAQDFDDVQVIAAIVQDAIIPVCDMLYNPAEKSFVMIAQRFRWDKSDEVTQCERICCALDITGVENVQRQGFDQADHSQMLDLLTLTLENDCLELIFAGNARLKLQLGKWLLRVEDFGDPWPTAHQPCHVT